MAAPSQSEHHDVAVVGGGVIGLAVAWRAAQRGLRTLVLDAGEDGAWRYAAGMLAPVTEAEFGEDALLDARPARRSRLSRPSAPSCRGVGPDPACDAGTLVVARDRDEAEELERLLRATAARSASRSSACARARRAAPSPRSRRRSGSRSTCPATTPSTRAALVAALAEAVERAGGEIRRERVDRTSADAAPRRPGRGRRRRLERRARRAADPAGQGPDHAPARPRGPGPRHAHDPHARGLPRPARRRPLRARRDGRGARAGTPRRPPAPRSS